MEPELSVPLTNAGASCMLVVLTRSRWCFRFKGNMPPILSCVLANYTKMNLEATFCQFCVFVSIFFSKCATLPEVSN